MNKDVIYIDAEDDVTAIIGKIKASKEKIVALVPPKHVGILQSAVNLRLLQRMATNANKRMVLITNNQALIALSAVASIPVAKNLQTKPEVAEIPALSIDDGDDIIDGAQLPIGELAKTADVASSDIPVRGAVNSFNIDDKPAAVSALGSAVKKINRSKDSGVKVPNFNSFRKKLFIGLGVLALLIAIFVWATWFAPAATVIITARTTPTEVNTTATLGGNAATDVAKGLIQSSVQQTKKDVSVDFDATGSVDKGSPASGTMTLSIKCSDVGGSPTIVPGGTGLSSGGKTFITQNDINLTNTAFSGGVCYFNGTGNVVSQSNGADYNLASGASYTVNGYSTVSGVGSAMVGGVTKLVTIVTAGDVQKASAALVGQPSDQIKAQLIKQFSNNQVPIDANSNDTSWTIDRAPAVSVPAIGAEATGKAKLTSSTTYSISAIAKSDLEIYLKANLDKQLVGKSNQRVYDDGIGKVKLSGYNNTGGISTVNIGSTGQVGPKIDETAIKQQVQGKIYGDVQSSLMAINGVDNVDVKFSFFWVHTVPNDVNRIKVEFKLQ